MPPRLTASKSRISVLLKCLLGLGSAFFVLSCVGLIVGSPPPQIAPKSNRATTFSSPTSRQLSCLQQSGATANVNATPETRAVLAYFRGLPERTDHRLVSGQFIGSGKFSSTKELDEIQEKTGKQVAMMGIDYALMHATDTTANSYIINHWNQGGLATISFHALNPQNHRFGSVKNRKINIQDLFNSDSKAYKNWIKDLDQVADGLKELQDHGVVVLWRPFHEMNKDFFWWGNRDVGDFVRLWRETFDYLTKTKGLNNLLWVYSPYQADDTAKYYPGDDFVDIVSMDAYETNPENIRGYEQLAAYDKPFGFGEYGPSGKLLVFVPIVDKNVDYYQIFNTILERFPRTTFLHAWNGGWGFQGHKNIDQMMNDPRMITRENVAWTSVCSE
jgi:mannan endo-1,4-beta-mannosidase